MNSSSVAANAVPAALGQPVELAAQDLPRRGGDGRVVVPLQVGDAHRRALRASGTRRSVSKSGFISKSP